MLFDFQYTSSNVNQLCDNFTFTTNAKVPSTLPRILPPVSETQSIRFSSNSNNRNAVIASDTTKLKSNLKRVDNAIQEGGITPGSLCRIHEAKAKATKMEITKQSNNDNHNGFSTQRDSHFSSSSLQSSSSSASTATSTSTCKLQSSPPSTLPKPVSFSNATTSFKNSPQQIRMDASSSDSGNSSLKRSSTAASINSIITKPPKLTTFSTPQAQVVMSPPPKEFDTNTTRLKSPLPSALSSSSSSSGIAGSSTSPVSSPTVSFADKPTYA